MTRNHLFSTYDVTVVIVFRNGWLYVVSYHATSKTEALYHGFCVYVGSTPSENDAAFVDIKIVIDSINRVLMNKDDLKIEAGDRSNSDELFQTSVNMIAEAKWEQAIQYLDKAIPKYPDEVRFLCLKGEVLGGMNRMGKWEKAIAAFDTALKTKPNCTLALGGKAMALAELGRQDKAEMNITKAIETFPEKAIDIDYIGRAIAYTARKKYPLAIKRLV